MDDRQFFSVLPCCCVNTSWCFMSNCFVWVHAHSATQCTFVVKETVEYYRRNHNDVYAMFLDASQAFDRVNFVKLFKLFIKKGLCPLITRFLLKLYTKQCLKIRWGTSTSEEFKVCNGVKQGSVLSPLLFSIYMDELIERLKRSGVGCYISNMFMGAFCYADDCTLLAPTLFSMKNLLDIVSKFGKDFDMKFNPVIYMCKLLVVNGSGSSVCKSLNH